MDVRWTYPLCSVCTQASDLLCTASVACRVSHCKLWQSGGEVSQATFCFLVGPLKGGIVAGGGSIALGYLGSGSKGCQGGGGCRSGAVEWTFKNVRQVGGGGEAARCWELFLKLSSLVSRSSDLLTLGGPGSWRLRLSTHLVTHPPSPPTHTDDTCDFSDPRTAKATTDNPE